MVIYEMEETPSSLLPYLLDVVVDVYEGERSSDNLPHGSGRCTFKNGSTYEGTWSEGFLQGQGTYVWKDDVQFKGDFNRNEIQGTGTFVWPNGDVYTGEVKSGRRNGKGKMVLEAEGTWYEGDWLDGKKHVEGTLDYGGGKTYVGHRRSDVKHGKGTMTYADGNVYQGDWCEGKKEGEGRMDYKSTNSFYVGDWSNDLPHGKGEHVWKDIGGRNPYLQTFNRYCGDFVEGLRHGQGTFFYATGASYKGTWRKNVKDGDGVFVYEDGTVFSGNIEKDRLPRRSPGSDTGPGFSVKVDISDLIGENSKESKVYNEDLSNSILRFNSELRAIYRKYSQIAVRSPKNQDMCNTSLVTEQIVEMCKHHNLVDLDYQLASVRDVISSVCAKLMQQTDTKYFEGSNCILYKDLVEILVRICFTKYHDLESPAQRFVTLVEQDLLPGAGKDPGPWHYLADPSQGGEAVRQCVQAEDAKLKSLFDALCTATNEVNAIDLLKLLTSKGFVVAPKTPPSEAAPEAETAEEEAETAEAEAPQEEPEAADAAETAEEAAEEEEKAAEEDQGETPAEEGGEAPAEEEPKEEAPAEPTEPETALTLALALKGLHVANFGSQMSAEAIRQEAEAENHQVPTLFAASISMKYPEFADALAVCADLAFDTEPDVLGFEQKFAKLMDALC